MIFQPDELVVESRARTLTDKDVMAMEQIMDQIDYATQTVSQLVMATESLRRAKTGPVSDLKRAVMLHRALRLSMARAYEDDVAKTTMVSESFTETDWVKVAEEEDSEGTSFIGRIIDAISKALSWLWEKITGLFGGTPEKDEKKSEKAEKRLAKLQEKIAANAQIAANSKLDGLDKTFSMVGKDLSIAELVDVMKHHEAVVNPLREAIMAMSGRMAACKDLAASVSSGSDVGELASKFTTLQADIISDLSKHLKDKYDPAVHGKLLKPSRGETLDPAQSWAIDKIATSSGMKALAIAVTVKGEIRSFAAAFGAPKQDENKPISVIMPTNYQDLVTVFETTAKFREVIIKERDEITNKLSQMKADIESAKAATEAMKKQTTGKDQAALLTMLKTFQQYTNGVGRIQVALVSAFTGLETAGDVFEKLCDRFLSDSGKDADKPEEPAPAPTGTPAPATT